MPPILPNQDIDLSFLTDIADGSNDFIIESISMFLQHTPELMQTIATGIASADWETVATAAHKLKPNLGFFGMPISQEMLQEIELMAKSSTPDSELLKLKFNLAQVIIAENIIALVKIKRELEN